MIIRHQYYLKCVLIIFSMLYLIYCGLRYRSTPVKKYLMELYNLTYSDHNVTEYNFRNEETQDFLINTPGCYIPNYAKSFKYDKTYIIDPNVGVCGKRAVYITSFYNNTIQFNINKKAMGSKRFRCCYKFAFQSTIPGHENNLLNYTKCISFEHLTTVFLMHEIIIVRCIAFFWLKWVNTYVRPFRKMRNIIYQDAYIILKKYDSEKKVNNPSWNILMLGVDTMSRARFFDAMPITSKYLKHFKWLDYKGYHKVQYNTFPNLMAVLTGKKMTNNDPKCSANMFKCANDFIWKDFKAAGYKTAYGEDYLTLPDTFYKGFGTKPTDHYMRPFYLTGERRYEQYLCAKNKPSATHLLDYANQFVTSYQNNSFFGLFWTNSYSRNRILNNPSILDAELIISIQKILNSSAANNTFIIIFSDHGIRYGEKRIQMESYYDNRLPMLFIWTPYDFRRQYTRKYYNLHLNQGRLTTPYDLYLTLAEILNLSINSSNLKESEACPKCTSLFKIKSPYRMCADAGVSEYWCSCTNMTDIINDVDRTERSARVALAHLRKKLKSLKLMPCTTCVPIKSYRVWRSHEYYNANKRINVIGFTVSFNISYEAVVENFCNVSEVISLRTISEYNTKGYCAINPDDRAFCACDLNLNCFSLNNYQSDSYSNE